MIVRVIIVSLISFASMYAQNVDERLLLIESQKFINYMDSFDQMSNKYTDLYTYTNISNIAQSVIRSMNLLLNVYHLIHIHNIIQGEEDKHIVGKYVFRQIPKLSRLLKIEHKITESILSLIKTKEIKDMTTLYINSLSYVITTLDTSVE